jgi:hypothetical protein
MNRRLALATLLASALTACQLGGDTTHFTAAATCVPATPGPGACTKDADCCSYGCVAGVCARNPTPGGVCRTTGDCGSLTDLQGTHQMLCKQGACTWSAGLLRDNGDICDTYNGDTECAAGNCAGDAYAAYGVCQPNHAPVVDLPPEIVVSYRKSAVLTPTTVSDQDGDVPLVYGWSLGSAPPGAPPVASLLSSQTVQAPTFTSSVIGDYVLTLAVTDGAPPRPNRLTASDAMLVRVRNLDPVVTALTANPSASRHVAQHPSASVSDPDGDALTCTWHATPPNGVPIDGIAAPCANAVVWDGAFGPGFTPEQEGPWTVTLDVSDGTNTIHPTATWQVVNDAPVVSAQTMPFYGNAGAAGTTFPPIPISGTASDRNGDAMTYAWTVDALALEPGQTSALHVGDPVAATLAASFTPDALGTYTLRLRATDMEGAFGEISVAVVVGRHVEDLGHDVLDAEFAAGKIVMVGDDATGTMGTLAVLDVATGTQKTLTLAAKPRCVSIESGGARAVVGDDANARWIALGSTTVAPTETKAVAAPFSVGDVAVVGTNGHAYLLPATSSINYYVTEYDSNGSLTATSVYGTAGAGDPGTTNGLFVADTSGFNFYTLARYSEGSKGGLNAVTTGSLTCPNPRLWAAQSGKHLFTSCGQIYADVTGTSTLGLLTVGLPAPKHLHSAPAGDVYLLDGSARTVRHYSASNAFGSVLDTADLPYWAQTDPSGNQTGGGTAATGQFVFVSADGRTRWVIVTAGGKTGLVTFP